MCDVTATGYVLCTRVADDNGDTVNVIAEWHGGDVIGVNNVLLGEGVERWIRREGDIIHICQFRVRVIDQRDGIWYARRIDESE